ncbi:MAG: DoxX family protein [Actinomycetota bacterium]|nr:DoxX family protein [Actinomycetota bacterium]
MQAYRLLPEVAAQVTGAGLSFAEFALGALLIIGAGVRAGAAVSVLLFAAFVIGISSAWARGLHVDCGCFGSGGQLRDGEAPGYGWELARDTGLLLVAGPLTARPRSRLAAENLLASTSQTQPEETQTS